MNLAEKIAPKTFKHSGDMGDIIFALPTIRALGGGVLYLDPQGGESDPAVKWPGYTRTKLNAKFIEWLKPLISRQPYIVKVEAWDGQPIDYNLDHFRHHFTFNNISDSHLAAFGLPFNHRDSAWLTVDSPIIIPGRPTVIARSTRYHGNYTFWSLNLARLKNECVFVGYPKEHEILEYTFEQKVPYFPTPDVLTLARVIAGCRRFISNQGLPHAIAEGMKKPLINEMYRVYPSAVFKRDGAQYV